MYQRLSNLPAIILFSAVFLLVFATGVLAGKTKTIADSFDVAPGGQLTLETDVGSIEIIPSKNGKLNIEVELEARTGNKEKAEQAFDEFSLELIPDGEDLEVIGEYDSRNSGNWFFGSKRTQLQVRYYIEVPQEYNVNVKTSGGSISVVDIEGFVRVRTSGGSLRFENINGSIRGKTSGGSIDLIGCTGNADVKTSGGSINVEKVEGDVTAHTSGGSITLLEAYGAVDLSTSGGSVTARLTEQPRDDCRLTTSAGNVNVYLPDDISVDIDAHTSGGRIRSSFPVRLSGNLSRNSWEGEINDGGPELYLRTSGGNINIREI